MTYWTETDIAKRLDGRFFQLQQKSLGKFCVVDLNEPEEPEDRPVPASRWTEHELLYLVELKRTGKTHAECADALGRTEYAVMSKWQQRLEWGGRIEVPRKQSGLWFDDIARVVCANFGISKMEFMSVRRSVNIVDARQVFYWLARTYTPFSLPQIGAFCGGRDHTTVHHGVRKIEEQIDRYRTKIELCVFDLGLCLSKQEAA